MVRGDARGTDRSVGPGLFIVREIARAHGGSVAEVSAPGLGSTFTFRVPGAAHAA